MLRAACDLQLLNDKTSKTMNHCSTLPATCTPPPLPASGPRTLLQSTRPLPESPPAHSQPHSICHDAMHPSPGHKVAIVALLRRASRPLAKPASSLAAVDRPPAFQRPAITIPSPHTGLHVSVYQPPTHVHPDSNLHPLKPPSPSSRFPSSKSSGRPRAQRPCSP